MTLLVWTASQDVSTVVSAPKERLGKDRTDCAFPKDGVRVSNYKLPTAFFNTFQLSEPFCPRNEIFLTSSQVTGCEETCVGCDDSRKGQAGCFCRSGYSRDPTTKECIRSSRCDRRRNGIEINRIQATQLNCTENELESCIDPCSDLCDRSDCTSPTRCVRQCACSAGMKRMSDGSCVPQEMCPPLLANEEEDVDVVDEEESNARLSRPVE